TMIAGVRALEPGSRLTVSAGAVGAPVRYWDLASAARAPHGLPREECLRRTRELLLDSVAAHLVSDVPVGAFLSGGIDSSAIVALMREAGQVARTFSVGFADARFDESSHAAAVAQMVGSDHMSLRLDEPALLDALPAALDAMDQPTG